MGKQDIQTALLPKLPLLFYFNFILAVSSWQGQGIRIKTKEQKYSQIHSCPDWHKVVNLRDLCRFKTPLLRNSPQIPAANSSIVIKGKRMRERALPKAFRLFSGISCNCCRWHSASDHLTTALKRRTSRMPRLSRSKTATKVSIRQRERHYQQDSSFIAILG